jgi:type I restriction enzyme S subunit
MYGATAGRVAQLEIQATINQAILSVVGLHSIVENGYLLHALSASAPVLVRQVQGSGQKNLSAALIRRLQIPVPPLGEQRKIAAILASVGETIEKTAAVIAQLQVVKKAMMQELLTRGLPGRHTRFKQTPLAEIPEPWGIATYGSLADDAPRAIQSGPFGSELKHAEFTKTGVLVIGIDNVLDGRFSSGANHRITREKFEKLSQFTARPLDLLITVMATVGRCCVVPEDIEPAIITKHVYRLTVNSSKANPYFLMYCLYGVPALAQAVRGSAQGLSRPGLNKSLLLPLLFPLPPRQEQDEIVASLQAIDARIDAEKASVASAASVKQALMAALLTGEVRVTPDEETP